MSREGLEQFPTEDLVSDPLWLEEGAGWQGERGEESEDEEEVEALFKEARLMDFEFVSHN